MWIQRDEPTNDPDASADRAKKRRNTIPSVQVNWLCMAGEYI
jgi:hypothetical protein